MRRQKVEKACRKKKPHELRKDAGAVICPLSPDKQREKWALRLDPLNQT